NAFPRPCVGPPALPPPPTAVCWGRRGPAMTKRRAAGFGIAAAAALTGAGLLLRPVPPETVTLENCRRVAPGMTPAGVEAVFGRPADQPLPPTRSWFGRDFALRATFGADGRVTRTETCKWAPFDWRHRVAQLLGF